MSTPDQSKNRVGSNVTLSSLGSHVMCPDKVTLLPTLFFDLVSTSNPPQVGWSCGTYRPQESSYHFRYEDGILHTIHTNKGTHIDSVYGVENSLLDHFS